MRNISKYLRKICVALVGIPLVIIGFILVPLPGPGLLVSFAGLFILSLEFDWAKPYMERVKKLMNKVVQKTQKMKNNSDNTEKKPKR